MQSVGTPLWQWVCCSSRVTQRCHLPAHPLVSLSLSASRCVLSSWGKTPTSTRARQWACHSVCRQVGRHGVIGSGGFGSASNCLLTCILFLRGCTKLAGACLSVTVCERVVRCGAMSQLLRCAVHAVCRRQGATKPGEHLQGACTGCWGADAQAWLPAEGEGRCLG